MHALIVLVSALWWYHAGCLLLLLVDLLLLLLLLLPEMSKVGEPRMLKCLLCRTAKFGTELQHAVQKLYSDTVDLR